MTQDQLFSSRPMSGYGRYRSPITGLYLCGAGTHPGGGVTGAPGHNSARAVLSDLGMRFGGEMRGWRDMRRSRHDARVSRLLERPGLRRAGVTLARQRWLRPLFDRLRSHS
jgi:hypothetical protein